MTNAIKYSTNGQTITLKGEIIEEGNNVFLKISVTDQGIGIQKEKLPHIFDKFWQAEATSSGHAASIGLGLTFCKLAIEAHGGKIAAESEVGKGTTIYLTLLLREYVANHNIIEPELEISE